MVTLLLLLFALVFALLGTFNVPLPINAIRASLMCFYTYLLISHTFH